MTEGEKRGTLAEKVPAEAKEGSSVPFWKNKWFKLACFAAVFVGYSVAVSLLIGTACLSKLIFGLPCPG